MTDWRRKLEALGGKNVCRITTRGRKTGKAHKVTIWFVRGEDDTIYLGTLRMNRDWPKNLLVNPQITLEIADLRLQGEAHQVTDETGRFRIESLILEKYWLARIGAWFGFKPEGVFAVHVTGEVS